MAGANAIDMLIPTGWEELEAFKVITMRVAERLRDSDEDWGLTRVEAASRFKRLVRERFRARREAERANRKAVIIVDTPELAPIALHRTASGMLAYQVQRYDGVVSLPWISILARAA